MVTLLTAQKKDAFTSQFQSGILMKPCQVYLIIQPHVLLSKILLKNGVIIIISVDKQITLWNIQDDYLKERFSSAIVLSLKMCGSCHSQLIGVISNDKLCMIFAQFGVVRNVKNLEQTLPQLQV